jgi:AraC-like DNA-binding protein
LTFRADKLIRSTLAPSLSSSGLQDLRWRAPHPRLEPFVFGHWIVSWDGAGPGPQATEALFYPCVNLVTDAERAYVRGVWRRRQIPAVSGRIGQIRSTNFHPGTFVAFSDHPVAALNDTDVSLNTTFGRAGQRLASELLGLASDEDAYFDCLEDFLLARDPQVDPRMKLVRLADQAMLDAAACVSVAELADRHGVSPRTLQRAFLDYVGVSPKWVLQRYRIHEAVERIAKEDQPDITSLALQLGYYDHAHFTRDFTEQTGRSPREYIRASAMRGRAAAHA